MIVRFWWRPQAWLARRPALTWLALGGSALAAGSALIPPSRLLVIAVAAAGLSVVACTRGLAGMLVGTAAAVITLGAAAWAGGGAGTCATIGALAALVIGPALAHLRGRNPIATQHQAGRATGFVWMLAQFAALGALGTGDQAAIIACGVLAVAMSLLVIPGVMPVAAHPAQPMPLATDGEGAFDHLVLPWLLCIAGLVWLPIRPSLAPPADISADRWLLAMLPIALLWGLSTLRLGVGIAALGGLLAGFACAKAWAIEVRADPLSVGILQAAPLLLWRRREALGAPALAATVAGVLVVAVGVLAPDWRLAALCAACVAVALAMLPEPPGGPAGDPLTTARRALAGMDPYWRCYGRAKLALDPLYRRLVAETRPWGRVLDLGCGPGLVAALAAGRADVTGYTGIDLDLDKLLIARRMLRRCRRPLSTDWQLVHAQLPMTATPGEPFSTVLVLDVLHYAPLATQRAVLTQARRQLADDGVLYLRDGLADTAGKAGRVGLGERFTTALGLNPAGGLHFLDEGAMRALLSETGFSMVACEPCGGENRLWIAHPCAVNPPPFPG